MSEHDEDKHVKTVSIYINGREFEVPKGEISFTAVVAYVYPHDENPQARYSVTYEKGDQGHKPDGVLVAGQTVKVKEGMMFVVSPTGQS